MASRDRKRLKGEPIIRKRLSRSDSGEDRDSSDIPMRRGRSRSADVGYGRPPKEHQFKPGQSGNPKGRAKGRKNEASIMQELLYRKIQLRENGQVRTASVIEAIYRRLADDALRGNLKAASFLIARHQTYAAVTAEQEELMSEDDQVILMKYAQEVLKSEQRQKKGKK